jgi:hypothetical protein
VRPCSFILAIFREIRRRRIERRDADFLQVVSEKAPPRFVGYARIWRALDSLFGEGRGETLRRKFWSFLRVRPASFG